MRIGVDDEREVERYRIEDPVALSVANELAEEWQRWGAIWAVRHYANQRGRVSIEDIEQAGRLGVIYASREYSEEKGKFPSWAKYYIMSECTKLLARGARAVSMPRDWKETIKPVMATMNHIRNNGEEPTLDQAINSLDLGKTKSEYIREIYTSAGREAGSFLDYRHGKMCESDLSEELDNLEMIERANEAMQKLPPMHRQCLEDQFQGISTRVTGERLGITVQTVHNYRRSALAWVRYALGFGPRPEQKQSSGGIKERVDYAKFA
jgi:RNA polymerase sigma factor (sigma-70 family)